MNAYDDGTEAMGETLLFRSLSLLACHFSFTPMCEDDDDGDFNFMRVSAS